MYQCIIAISSNTIAMKAQKLLSDFAIPSQVVNVDARKTSRGCAYGIALSCANVKNAENLFKRFGISYSDILR